MVIGTKSKQIAYDYVSSIENVKILSTKEKIKLGFKPTLDVWEVDTEISHDSKLIQIVFHIEFTNDFPLVFPKVYISPDTYERTKYIPHIDSRRLVCTYDTEIVTTNPLEPVGIIVESIKKAKNIILDGISGSNHSDFNIEFKAYWEDKYGNEKHLPSTILSLTDQIKPESSLKLICLKNYIRIYRHILHESDEKASQFKNFLDKHKYSYNEVDVYFLDNFPIDKPPFDIKNRDILDLLKDRGDESFERFKGFINKYEFPKFVICKKNIEGKQYLFGWFHQHIETNRNGFRAGALNQFKALSTFQSNQNVKRVTTDIFTKERLANRTSGILPEINEKSFLIAGVGSIGSNLLYFLNSMNSPEFRLVDTDMVQLENIQRHLLGFEHIGNYKTKAIKEYLLKSNPIQKVSTKESSIIKVLNEESSYINDVDYIFVAIGKSNIDNWICQSIKDGMVNKPVFLIWVEPYLCGGHCLYLHPSNPEFENLYDNDFFKYNVIDSSEYNSANSKLSLREAGCQTTYIPYSSSNVINFLSSIFPYISSIIDFNSTESKALSWIGNIKVINEMGIKISDNYKNIAAGTITEHTI
jgi:hypothetical protein